MLNKEDKNMKQLRITTSAPDIMGVSGTPLSIPLNPEAIIPLTTLKANVAYLHDDAEALAGYDIPIFIDGDMNNLNLPVEEQDIVLLLPQGEFKCKSELEDEMTRKAYYITLRQGDKEHENI